jgi:predicted PhzF superfamily epimerase YddE/YHI9
LYQYLNFQGDEIAFNSLSGKLRVLKNGKRFVLDFPGRVVAAIPPPKSLIAAMDTCIEEVATSGDDTYIVLLKTEADVLNFKPDFSKLGTLDHCVNITAKGKDCDFVSRFFAPIWGIPEDPVTGSAHCGLAIYWSRRLQKTGELHAFQVSQRGGELFCKVDGERVFIAGEAAPYMRGTITIPAF